MQSQAWRLEIQIWYVNTDICLPLGEGNCFIDFQRHLQFNKYLSLGVCLLTPIERITSLADFWKLFNKLLGVAYEKNKQLEMHLNGRLLKTYSH